MRKWKCEMRYCGSWHRDSCRRMVNEPGDSIRRSWSLARWCARHESRSVLNALSGVIAEQFGQGSEFITGSPRILDNARESIRGLHSVAFRVVPIAVVKQH